MNQLEKDQLAQEYKTECAIQEHNTLIQQYKEEIHNKLDEIDPDDTEDWRSMRAMAVGWAIGKGVSIESTRIFASYVSSCSLD